jgi:hypothetical protein
MRWIALVAGTLLTTGCAAPEKPPTPQNLASKPCAQLALTRMEDARANGSDARIQQITFRGTYADCVAWEAKGFEPSTP